LKTIKRVIAILLLIVTVALVGYLIFTGSRLPTITDAGGVYEEITSV